MRALRFPFKGYGGDELELCSFQRFELRAASGGLHLNPVRCFFVPSASGSVQVIRMRSWCIHAFAVGSQIRAALGPCFHAAVMREEEKP